ncbi:MAG TPA: putative nucleotidyltransferase substrate binding domain-containing protein [Solirubrobacteraceae bacterium]|nr:putative nucleotidyltransferase substrate binding domain-containing protein [Solirubrobacteraceae bacterium]
MTHNNLLSDRSEKQVEIAEFLRGHELFQGLEPQEVEEIAARVAVESFAPRTVIVSPGEQTAGAIRLVRHGAVDLVDHGRALDRLGEGELFGHPSMLSGLPPGFEVRAAEETTCFRLDRGDALRLLGRPTGLRYVARSLLARPPRATAPLAGTVDPTRQRVDQLTREPAVVCGPELSIREAARMMVERPASCVLVRGEGDVLGIVTDRDLRSRVLAADCSADAPIAEIMSSPAVTVRPEQRAADATLTMLDRGIRHLPIVAARGEIVGVLREIDLLAAQARTPFVVRSAIAASQDLDELRRAATRLEGTVVALHDARMDAAQIGGVISTVTDAVTRRLLELAGGAAPELAWIALGSHGRREAMPGSDLDSAVAWAGDDDQADAVRAVATEVVAGLEACGIHSDSHGAAATNGLFARSTGDWDRRVRELLADPGGEQAMILVSLVCDGRMVTGRESLPDPFAALEHAPSRPILLRLLLRVGLAPRPPTGFLRDVVVEHSGEHRGRFDIKRGGVLPLVNLARFGAVAAGSRVTSTVERLRIAADAGTLPRETAGSLEEAFDLLTALRLDHQVELLRAGRPADDFIDPRTLNPLARRYLRDAFRAIASIQRTLGNELEFDVVG